MANSGSSRKSTGRTQSNRSTSSGRRTGASGSARGSSSSYGRNTARTQRSSGSAARSRSSASGSRSRSTGSRSYNTSVRRRQAAEQEELIRDVKGIVIFAAMIFLFLCNFGILGKVGNVVSSVLFGLTGLPAYILPILILGLVFYHLQNREDAIADRKIGAVIGLYASVCIICELVTAGMTRDSIYHISEIYIRCAQNKSGGGILFGSVAFFLYKFFGTVGCVLVLIVLFLICAIILSQQPLMHLAGERAADARNNMQRHEMYDAENDESYDDEDEDDYPEDDNLTDEQESAADEREHMGTHQAGNDRSTTHDSGHPRSFWDYLYDSRERSDQQKREHQQKKEQQKLLREREEERRRMQQSEPGMHSSIDENGDTIYHGMLSDPLIGNHSDLQKTEENKPGVSAANPAAVQNSSENRNEKQKEGEPDEIDAAIAAGLPKADTLSPVKPDASGTEEGKTDGPGPSASEESSDTDQPRHPRQNLHEIYYQEDAASKDAAPSADPSASQTEDQMAENGVCQTNPAPGEMYNAKGQPDALSDGTAEESEQNAKTSDDINPFSALSAVDAADSQDPFTRKVIEQSIGLASATEAARVSSKVLTNAAMQTKASDLHEVEGSGSMTGHFPRRSSGVLSFDGEDNVVPENQKQQTIGEGEELTPIGPADNDKDRPEYSMQEPVRRQAWPDENAIPAVPADTDTYHSEGPDTDSENNVSGNNTDGNLQKWQSVMLQRAHDAIAGTATAEAISGAERPSATDTDQDTNAKTEYPVNIKAEGRTDTGAGADTKNDSSMLHRPSETPSHENIRNTALKSENASGKTQQMQKPTKKPKPYVFPPMDLLKKGAGADADSNEELRNTAQNLQKTLRTFGVNVHITAISQGPAVTRYELQPEQGVKVSRIVSLSDDIKLALAATDIRIEAPIPGKSAIGIEVPNKHPAIVKLRDVLDTEEFRSSRSKVSFALGKDISGRTVISNIAKMPHLLIAGATGSGKSVCINTIIMSIIYHARPDEVKLLMIDPKVVELSVYNGIPHLQYPVVTDPHKASALLKWAVAEMEERYKKFAASHVRNISGYNAYIRQRHDAGQDLDIRPMPEMVIIVDELADLMMVAKNDVETSICRLTQLARAAGMYLIIATQRPSVDVITGLIKANMPSRIAFAVSSGTDSRTILDMNGAEKLLGKGDMLYSPAGSQKPVRIQGAFVSDEEVAGVVNFLLQNNSSTQDTSEMDKQISLVSSESAGEPGPSTSSEPAQDELFVDAGKFIIERQNASIGLLQRRFRIGFNRAARIMDQLCDAGVVAESEGTKSRRILMDEMQFENYCENM